LIGDSGGGGGGGGGAGGSGGSAAGEAASGGAETEVTEAHNLDVKFVDKGGFPIAGVGYTLKSPSGRTGQGTLMGRVKQTVFEEGDYEIELKAITKAEWSKKEARDGETVKMFVETSGFEDGTKAGFEVWERDFNKADQRIKTIEGVAVKGNKVEAEWAYEYSEDDELSKDDEKYSFPQYYFVVSLEGIRAKSALLKYKDWIELQLEDEDGNSMPDEEYVLYLSNGEIRSGKLDSNGYKKETNIPPGACRIDFPNAEDALLLD
jgi:hypothetical protein